MVEQRKELMIQASKQVRKNYMLKVVFQFNGNMVDYSIKSLKGLSSWSTG